MSKLQKIIEDIKNNTITKLDLYNNAIGNKNTKEKVDDIIKRNIECQRNTIKFLNDNFIEKNDKFIINLLDNIKKFYKEQIEKENS